MLSVPLEDSEVKYKIRRIQEEILICLVAVDIELDVDHHIFRTAEVITDLGRKYLP